MVCLILKHSIWFDIITETQVNAQSLTEQLLTLSLVFYFQHVKFHHINLEQPKHMFSKGQNVQQE